jgi:hypothetical protein
MDMEKLIDVEGVGVSNCCGAKVYAPTSEWAICKECNDYCTEENE